MNNNKIEINIPDFIDYQEIEETIKSEIKSNIKYWVKTDILQSKDFKDIIKEEIRKEINNLLSSTNLNDILQQNVVKSIDLYFEDISDFKYSSNIRKVVEDIVISEKDFINSKTINAVDELLGSKDEITSMITWRVQDLIIENTIQELMKGDYVDFVREMVHQNFESYFPRKDDIDE